MSDLTVTAYSGNEDLLGKTVDDLQTGVAVSDNAVSGTLKYVTDYTGFSGDVAEQSGNYLVLQAESENAGAVITAEVIDGDHGPVTLDEDGILVARIKNTSQKVKFTVTADGYNTNEQEFDLTGLTLAGE